MLFLRLVFLTLIICISGPGWTAELVKPFWVGPFFWESKPEIAERMRTQRYIPVSMISTEEKNGDKNQIVWWMKGAGLVKAPAQFVFDYAKDLDRLAQQKDHFSEMHWLNDHTELEFNFKALGTTVKFRIKLWEAKVDDFLQLHFKFLAGPLTGAEGVILIKEVARQESQVSLILRHEGNILSFGNTIMSIAVEGVLHHMAESLRSAVEQSWLDNQKPLKPAN